MSGNLRGGQAARPEPRFSPLAGVGSLRIRSSVGLRDRKSSQPIRRGDACKEDLGTTVGAPPRPRPPTAPLWPAPAPARPSAAHHARSVQSLSRVSPPLATPAL